MATKLKNMRLTSVDLVRSGANQEADICLYKSADIADGDEAPTEREKNIFKRFINWLKENPAEDEHEPENPVEKADDNELLDPTDIYKSAITESLQSIVEDESLTAIEKSNMIAESIGQYHEAMVQLLSVQKADDMDYLFEDLEKSDKFDVITEI